MRVLWLQDIGPFCQQGGAQLSDHACILEGIRRGHEVVIGLPEYVREGALEHSDLVVVSNATRFDARFLVRAAERRPYVMYLHDYWPLCKYRLYYPMLEKCRRCGSLGFARRMLLGSSLNVFLSPLHLDAWAFVIPELRGHPRHLHPSPVDTERFRPTGSRRVPNTVLGVNCLLPFKGAERVLEYAAQHPELSFTFVGARGNAKLPGNCRFLGYVPNERMPELYSTCEYFVHLPKSPQPCERTAIEAKLCGAKLIINPLVGAASYDWFRRDVETVRKHIRGAPAKFWESIEREVTG